MSHDAQPDHAGRSGLVQTLNRTVLGRKKDVRDPNVFHAVSLVAFFAWVGLGADGLSSSAYGPEEMFRALGEHTSLAVALAIASAFTIAIISWTYSRIIERFPFGGGGYVVASRLLGPRAGVVSGAALMVDYVLTITTSIAAGVDAIFSLLPQESQATKLVTAGVVIGVLVVLNLRGVKESVTTLTPIFLLYVVTHVVLLGGAFLVRGAELGRVSSEVHSGVRQAFLALGTLGVFKLFLRAYSMGAGTYTGIEAVSNGLQIMREPRVATGKHTMVLMAASLALTAGGITLCYLLLNVGHVDGKTMNAVLAERFAALAGWTGGGGTAFVGVTLASEALLLFVAAQAGFIDGPRVLANLATDSWAPHRFAQLSNRLTMQDGVLLMGGTSLAALVYTRGDVSTLVSMYAINVFVTFSLSQLSMVRYWWLERRAGVKAWKGGFALHLVGLALTSTILVVNVAEKFVEGGWVTIAVTATLVGAFFLIKLHYSKVQQNLSRLDAVLSDLPTPGIAPAPPLDPKGQTAVLLVGSYAGLGIHSLLTVLRVFPGLYRNLVFLSVAVIDSATFKDQKEVEEVVARAQTALDHYVSLAQRLGLAATSRLAVGTEVVEEAEGLCAQVAAEFPRSVCFAGKLIFERETIFQRVLHNETGFQLQRHLQFKGINTVVLPVRVPA